jgi:HD-like signal output (HDOD) protein
MPAAVMTAAAPETRDIEAKMRVEVRNIGIPPRPAILDRINSEMQKDEPDFKRLAETIGSDVGLAASVVKVANSPFFGFGKKVRSVQEALLVLGLKISVRTIAGLALQKTFPHVPSLERFWDSSACAARVSGWLVQHLGRGSGVRADDAYTFGLFRDCGIPVLMIPFPEYQAVLKAANNESALSFTEVEDRAMSINHAIVGAELAEDWLLPEEIHLAIRYHHDAAAIAGAAATPIPEPARRLIAVAQVAEYLIHRHTGLSHTSEWDKIGPTCMELLKLGADDIDGLLADCHAAVKGE